MILIFVSFRIANLVHSVAENELGLSHSPLLNFTYIESDNGNLTLTLKVKEYFYNNSDLNVAFWTRLYNPTKQSGENLELGPLIYAKRGDLLTVNLENHLGVDSGSYTELNTFHNVNHTNLHTHGLHVQSNLPQDDIFIDIKPGENFSYVYQLPPHHSGGTFWYHAHR